MPGAIHAVWVSVLFYFPPAKVEVLDEHSTMARIPELVRNLSDPFEIRMEEIRFEDYCSKVGTRPVVVDGHLTHLQSLRFRYSVDVHAPDNLNPHGRLAISHPVYPDGVRVVIHSSQEYPVSRFDVSRLAPSTLRPHAAHLPFETALDVAVETATYYRFYHSPVLPPHPRVRRAARRLWSVVWG